MTLSAWVFLLSYPPSPKAHQDKAPLIQKGQTGDWEYALNIYKDGTAGMEIMAPKGTPIVSPRGGQVPLEKWTHVCGVYGPGQARLFIQGQEAASAPHDGQPASGNAPLEIGARQDGWQFLHGALSGVRLYARALTAEEIKDSMAGPGRP
jgi:MSHA biogenesis protein MshQ